MEPDGLVESDEDAYTLLFRTHRRLRFGKLFGQYEKSIVYNFEAWPTCQTIVRVIVYRINSVFEVVSRNSYA